MSDVIPNSSLSQRLHNLREEISLWQTGLWVPLGTLGSLHLASP